MKKYIILIVSTFLLIGIAFFIPQIALSSYPEVEVTQLKSTYVQDVVSADGRLQEENQTEITTDFPFVIKQVLVEEGDIVEIGDCLATVDKPATQSSLTNLAETVGERLEDETADELSAALNSGRGIVIPDGIYATAKGTVTSVALQSHALSPVGEPAVILSDLSNIQVLVQVGEIKASEIAIGQQAVIKGKGLGNSSYQATVTDIAPTATSQLNGMTMETVVNVTLDVEGEDDKLKPGYQVSAEINTGEAARIMVPYAAVGQDENGGEYVYIYQDGKAVKKYIETGKEEDESVEIVSGVSAGEWIVTEQDRISGDEVFVFATVKE